MKRTLICLATLALATLPAVAQSVPPLINYQGLLSDASGVPLASGSHDLVFSLYASPEATTSVWGPEAHESAQVVQGRFNVILGSTVPLGAAFSGPDRWLGVSVSPEAEITPRQRVLSTPYAMTAQNGSPIGGVIMWWGNVADIPHGWQLCDGSPITVGPLAGTDTPDLTDRFVRGASDADSSLGDLSLGGNNSVSLSVANLPNHQHANRDAYWLESASSMDQIWDTYFDEAYFGRETAPLPSNTTGYHGASARDYPNQHFIYRKYHTEGVSGATAQSFSVVSSHQELFFIIRVL
jgi:microcystin-dependent protein